MVDINKLVEGYFKPKKDSISLDDFLNMLQEVSSNVLQEGEKTRGFTVSQEEGETIKIPIPRFTPSEAWGDPSSQDRAEVDKLFRVITGGADIAANIDSVNKFLTPESAKKKNSPNVILNMMMIVEALQAALNDYNESAAGFVFEGFMAALSGGHQVAGKVAGTLPIEDYIAFSSFGTGVPVSLKLLSGNTPVKGSFTNLIDFLFVRGSPEIKYLVAYKQVTGKGYVELLNIFAFDITQANFVDFIVGALEESLFGKYKPNSVKRAILAYTQNKDLVSLAQMFTQFDGYNRAGLMHGFLRTGELPREPTPEEKEEAEERRAERSQKATARLLKSPLAQSEEESQDAKDARIMDTARRFQKIDESINCGELTLNEAFHYVEKQTLLTEAGEKQWSASFPQLERLGSTINKEYYGQLDLSQKNIDELSKIYSTILRGGIIELLHKAKDLTENIGAYYSEEKRSTAQAAALDAVQDADAIKIILQDDPVWSEKEVEP